MIVALINDTTFDEPHVVFGKDYRAVARAVVAYLRATQPVDASTGDRLAVPVDVASDLDFLERHLPDLEDIDVQMHPCSGSESFTAWCLANASSLRDQHRKMIETIKTVGNLI